MAIGVEFGIEDSRHRDEAINQFGEFIVVSNADSKRKRISSQNRGQPAAIVGGHRSDDSRHRREPVLKFSGQYVLIGDRYPLGQRLFADRLNRSWRNLREVGARCRKADYFNLLPDRDAPFPPGLLNTHAARRILHKHGAPARVEERKGTLEFDDLMPGWEDRPMNWKIPNCC
jgi:hypothetical protein